MSIAKEDERSIIEAVLSGETARFEELMHAHEKGIYNFCLRMLGNTEDALDASQEVFFKAYRALRSFRGESRFSTWLYRLAENVCLDMLRKRPKYPTLSTDDEESVFTLKDPAPSAQEKLEQSELRSVLTKALSDLPDDFREVVVLRDVISLSYDEIAEITLLEPGTVKSRIFRGRKKLAEALLRDGNFLDLYSSENKRKKRSKGGAVQ